jgi:hypothetical protein
MISHHRGNLGPRLAHYLVGSGTKLVGAASRNEQFDALPRQRHSAAESKAGTCPCHDGPTFSDSKIHSEVPL